MRIGYGPEMMINTCVLLFGEDLLLHLLTGWEKYVEYLCVDWYDNKVDGSDSGGREAEMLDESSFFLMIIRPEFVTIPPIVCAKIELLQLKTLVVVVSWHFQHVLSAIRD